MPSGDGPFPEGAVRRRILQVIAQIAVLAAVLLLSSGRLAWGMAWPHLEGRRHSPAGQMHESEPSGYEDLFGRVHYRLVPGLW